MNDVILRIAQALTGALIIAFIVAAMLGYTG